ncbi:MAG: type IX secretion system sortase PorU [Bacteroidales bacterium]|nr:type IX secretion system sortase PorU [Bacteroidales bacterium]
MTLFHRVTTYLLRLCALSTIIFAGTSSLYAFPTDTYASKSVLAEGRWVKISVDETGMYCISDAELKRRGFADPSKVKVYGYGGQRISDILSQENYIDDLPQVQSEHTSKGLVFYGVGPASWSLVSSRWHHTLNPFSELGYYYLSDREMETRAIPEENSARKSVMAATTFIDRMYHEVDRTSLGFTGHLLLGEDLRRNPNLTLSFNLPGRVTGTPVWMKTTIVTKATSASTVVFTANGNNIEENVNTIAAASSKNYGRTATFTKTFTIDSDKLQLGIALNAPAAATAAYLDYVTINYTREMRMIDNLLQFRLTTTGGRLTSGNANTRVWDVTDPLDIRAMATLKENDNLYWINPYSGSRSYVAWSESASFLTPKYVETVTNQNLHDLSISPEMVIFTHSEWAAQAQRLADFHSQNDKMEVLVVTMDKVYNEFSSGTRDVNSMRKLLKMYYDRGLESGKPLRYALIMGRPTFDNRRLTDEIKNITYPLMPTWESDEGLVSTESYTTDDVFAFLEDNSGSRMGSDRLCIAVGRAPARSVGEARNFVDKVIAYSTESPKTGWKNHVMLIADDGDRGEHMNQTEKMVKNMMADPSGSNMTYSKIYVDAYDEIGGMSQEGYNLMHRYLDEGVMLWTYVGHAHQTMLGSEGLLNYADIDKLSLSHYPIFYGATCLYFEWDNHNECAGEALFNKEKGGFVAGISATRSVYIVENGTLNSLFGQEVFKRKADGTLSTIGEVYMNTKNCLTGNRTNTNKLRYVLMGDPAMRMATPQSTVSLELVDGQSTNVDEADFPAIMARQNVELRGTIYAPDGSAMTDFNGTIDVTLHDAEYSVTSQGRPSDDTEGEPVTFEMYGEKLFAGRGTVVNGDFTVKVPMPSEISDNYRPAMLNMYALSNDGTTEASGVSRNFYVYGFDETADADTKAPVINYAYLNHESFVPGATVNDSPMFIAKVTDDTGINLSTAGVGHQMTIQVDNRTVYNNVATYFTPSTDGTPSGTIAYPMSGLDNGNHTLTFRVWDTSGNSTSTQLDFFVAEGASPQMFDVYTDANPASTSANFFISHDRPNTDMTVTISVYNLMGRLVWTSTSTDRSDMFLTSPVNWNLLDMGGHRVPRGIYIYRATLSVPGSDKEESIGKRIAVTAP